MTSAGDSDWAFGPTDNITDHYDLGIKVGNSGAFGYARKVTCKKTGTIYACKVIQKARLGLGVGEGGGEEKHHNRLDSGYSSGSAISAVGDYNSPTTQVKRTHILASLRNEVNILKKLKHPSIVKLEEVFEDKERLYLVMEFCSGGELFDRIAACTRYTEKDAFEVVRQLFEGVAHMHSLGVAHFDLKPENLMFANTSIEAPVKIIDFGMAQIEKSRRDGKYFSTHCGTLCYTSPEVLAGKYDMSADMWSLGCILFTMLIGYPPFHGDDEKIIRAKIKGKFLSEVKPGFGTWFPQIRPISQMAMNLISKLLEKDVARRLTAKEALSDPWLANKGENLSDKPLVSSVLDGLKSLGRMNKFKQVVLNMLVQHIPNDEIDSLKRAFSAMDKNGDGVLSVDELKQVMAQHLRKRETSSTFILSSPTMALSTPPALESSSTTSNGSTSTVPFLPSSSASSDSSSANVGATTRSRSRKTPSTPLPEKKTPANKRKKTSRNRPVREASPEGKQSTLSAEDDAELQNFIASLDADGDGGLSYHELLLATAQRKLLAKEERMWTAFQALDHNGDGEVDASELASILGTLEGGDTLSRARELIALVDANGDGRLSYEEFLAAWHTMQPETQIIDI